MMSGCSQHDIRTSSPASQAGRAGIAFALCSDLDATSKGSSFHEVSLQTSLPAEAPGIPLCPRWPCAPLPVRGSRERGDLPPRPSLSAGFTWMGRFICKTQAGVGGQWQCRVPPKTLSTGHSKIWPEAGTGDQGGEQGKDLQEQSRGSGPC